MQQVKREIKINQSLTTFIIEAISIDYFMTFICENPCFEVDVCFVISSCTVDIKVSTFARLL